MRERLGVVNVQMGNLRSVSNAFDQLGFDVMLIEAPSQLDDLTHLVLPGVGAFGTAMQRLSTGGLDEGVRAFAASGRPLLGLCLGMHLLTSVGSEGGTTPGLGLVPGRVSRLPADQMRVPHVGWNSMELRARHPLFERIKDGRDYYFVHSFVTEVDEEHDVLGSTEYGVLFPSAIGRDNVVGLQFHPEKSQLNGLRLLENFALWDGRC